MDREESRVQYQGIQLTDGYTRRYRIHLQGIRVGGCWSNRFADDREESRVRYQDAVAMIRKVQG